MSSKDQPFDLKGVKQSALSADIYTGCDYSELVEELMRYSFYMPVDVLQNPRWIVDPVKVITGKQFTEWLRNFGANYKVRVHTDTSYWLLKQANYVGISKRHNAVEGSYYCCKVWYGKPIQKLIEDIKLDDL